MTYETINEPLEKIKKQIEENDLDGAIYYLKNSAPKTSGELENIEFDKVKEIETFLENKIKGTPSINGINKLFKETSNNLSKSELKFTEDYLNQIEGIQNVQFIIKCLTTPELETYFSNEIKKIEE